MKDRVMEFPATSRNAAKWQIVNTSGTLPELIEELNRVCAGAERGEEFVLISAVGPPPESRAWPGPTRVTEINRWERAVRRLERLPCPILSLISGVCGGPSLDLMLASDYRVAARDMRLLLPVNDGQFWPGMGVHRLVTQLGVAAARRIVLWGSELTADEAVTIGLVDEVASDVQMSISAAQTLLGGQDGAELAVRRQLLLEASSSSYEAALGVHLAACDRELRRLTRQATGGRQSAGGDPAAGGDSP